MEWEHLYREYKPLLFSIAYRLLGSVTDAEDMVQETFAAVHAATSAAVGSDPFGRPVDNWRAYLCRAVTNRCMDLLKSAHKKRELYVGPWLPEPLVQRVAQPGDEPLEATLLEETVSYAFLVMLERLSPLERAVFVLREAFEYSYRDIADIVGKTELACRQTHSRVRRKVQAEPATVPVDAEASRTLVKRFLHAAATGDVRALIEVLSEEATLLSDGGGKRLAALQPIVGRDRVIAFLAGLAAKLGAAMAVHEAVVGGEYGLILEAPDGPTVVLFSLQADGRCLHIYLLRNPDKLTTLQKLLET
jgi:RNA polymerase sigma-70 factor (TIGR02957 family)